MCNIYWLIDILQKLVCYYLCVDTEQCHSSKCCDKQCQNIIFILGLWRAPQLVHVDLHSNLIEEIQPDIIHCQSLEMLFLMRNKLRYIPNQINFLPHLNTFAVASNLLENFPLSVASMTNLRQLSVADNRKLRRIPIDVLKLHNLQLLLSRYVITIDIHVSDDDPLIVV